MKARKLPSGSWRCLVYSHTEHITQPDGTTKDKRIYKSFTCDTPGPAGKRECERMAAEWAAEKNIKKLKKQTDYGEMTLSDAIDKYIESRVALDRSPTTIQDYKCIKANGFQDMMEMKLKDLDENIIQEMINTESRRPAHWNRKKTSHISAKRLRNEWGLIGATLRKYARHIDLSEVELPQVQERIVELPSAAKVLGIIRGTDIELPVLLAAWLSFTMSEVRGLTKSKSISGDYITVREVVVDVGHEAIRKEKAKNETRNRTHRIPAYIKYLIDQVKGDELVPMSGRALYHKWIQLQDKNGMNRITFHDLRHLNASIMALLRIPDKYAQERGGWKSDKVMKGRYMQVFSEERQRFDDVIDTYFETIMDGITNPMQHEMQHGKEKTL